MLVADQVSGQRRLLSRFWSRVQWWAKVTAIATVSVQNGLYCSRDIGTLVRIPGGDYDVCEDEPRKKNKTGM